jgi:hypothetical protein
MKKETCTGTLQRDPDGKWYADTQLVKKAYLDPSLQHRPDANLVGTEVGVTLAVNGHLGTVVDYHFL